MTQRDAVHSLSAASTTLPTTVPSWRQLGDRRVDSLGGAGADRHGGAFGEQRLGGRPADSLRRACDECLLAGESEVHGTAPLMSKYFPA